MSLRYGSGFEVHLGLSQLNRVPLELKPMKPLTMGLAEADLARFGSMITYRD